MNALQRADREDIDWQLYDEIESTFEAIVVLVAEARDEERIPGCGPDRPDDLVGVLISPLYKAQLDLPFYRHLRALAEKTDILEVPLIPFVPLQRDYAPVRREDAEALFDTLAEDYLEREEFRIAEHVLAQHESVESSAPHLPQHLMFAVEAALLGELDRARWPGA